MIPKRALSALVGTVAALALLLSFKTPTEGLTSTLPGSAVGRVDPQSLGGTPAGGGTGGTGGPATTGTGGGDGNTGAAAPTPAPTAGGTGGSSGGVVAGNGTVTGPVVQTQFGDIQVAVTVSNGKIADIQALQLPSWDRHSRSISSRAEPRLRQEALTAQSAQIDIVSGATFTSMAYAQSLQGALDQLNG